MRQFIALLASRMAHAVNRWDDDAAALVERHRCARVVALGAWLCLAAGTGLLLTTLLPANHIPDAIPFRRHVIAAAALAFGYRLIRITAVAAYRRSLAVAARGEIVYARPFAFDTRQLPFGRYRRNWVAKVGDAMGDWDDMTTFEDYAVTALSRFGRVSCLANPQRTMVFGAAKLHADDDLWRHTFIECVKRASLAVIVLDSTDAVLWEVRTLFALLPPDRIIMVLPFRAVYAFPDTEYTRLRALTNELVPTALPPQLKDTLALWYDRHHVCHTVAAQPGVGTGEQLVRALTAAACAVSHDAGVSDGLVAPSDWTRQLRNVALGIFVWCGLLSQMAMRAAGHCEHREFPILKRPYVSVGDVDRAFGWCEPDAELGNEFRSLQSRLSALAVVHGRMHGVEPYQSGPAALRSRNGSSVRRRGVPPVVPSESDAEAAERRAEGGLAACEATGMVRSLAQKLGVLEIRVGLPLSPRDRADVAGQLRTLTASLDETAAAGCHFLGCQPLLDWRIPAAQSQGPQPQP